MGKNNRGRPSKNARALLLKEGGVKAVYQEQWNRKMNMRLNNNNSTVHNINGNHLKSNNINEGNDRKISTEPCGGRKRDFEENTGNIDYNKKHSYYRDEDVYGPQEISSWADLKDLEDEKEQKYSVITKLAKSFMEYASKNGVAALLTELELKINTVKALHDKPNYIEHT